MTISLNICFLTVHDPDLAIAFYRDTLGLELTNDVAADDYRWVTVTAPGRTGTEIVLVQPHAGKSQDDGDALAALLAKGSLPGLIFEVDELDPFFEKVQASGAEVLQEPMDQFWGRDCAFRDPSGNMIRIKQRRE